MAVKLKLSSPFSCVSAHISSSLQDKAKFKLSSRLGCFDCRHFNAEPSKNIRVLKSCHLLHGKTALKEKLSKKHCVFFACSEDLESYSEFEEDNLDLELENEQTSLEGAITEDISDEHIIDSGGKSGFVSFYRRPKEEMKDQTIVSSTVKNQNYLLWFVGPTVLVASFVFPSLYLRRILSTIFEDSLLTDFLILFFTEALFYCGVAVFLLLIDHVRRPMDLLSPMENIYPTPHLSQRISSVAVLVLSLIIPMVTMGFVWPWTGPAASATLAPYLVGIIVQFAFERYAKHIRSPSWPAIPIIFQIYRLHQLNRAAQLVTALSFTVRGAEMTSHNLAINGSLSTLLNVLQFLGVICIWSLSSFVMRYFPSVTIPEP